MRACSSSPATSSKRSGWRGARTMRASGNARRTVRKVSMNRRSSPFMLLPTTMIGLVPPGARRERMAPTSATSCAAT
ncbi:MAG: hypothetical protein DMG07_22415 [Acidobacteria bacterium]|nr:MAG: hypothetical protein DMG07_22415 [Acidobacteriota bacterium]